MLKVNCGNLIKAKRVECGISQNELGEKLGVSRKTISSWEVNRTEPKMGDIEKMAEVFRCRKSDLIGTGTFATSKENSELLKIMNQYNSADEQTKAMVRRLLAYAERTDANV